MDKDLLDVLTRIAAALETLTQALIPEPTPRETYQGEQPTPYLEQLIDGIAGLYPMRREIEHLEREFTKLYGLQQSFAASVTADSQQIHQRLDRLESSLTEG